MKQSDEGRISARALTATSRRAAEVNAAVSGRPDLARCAALLSNHGQLETLHASRQRGPAGHRRCHLMYFLA